MRTSRILRHLPIRVVLAASLLASAAAALVNVPAASASTLGGTATISDLTNASGSASTDLFTLTFPSGAACTGSSNGSPGYFEYSYLFPQGAVTEANLASSLTFNGAGDPNQSWAFGLLESNGTLFEAGDTAPPTVSGGPGQLANIPTNFEWAELVTTDAYPLDGSGGLLYNDNTSGIWEAGIACAYNNGTTHVISDFWNTEVTFTASSSDPNRFTWSAVPGLGTWVPEARWAVTLPVAGVAVLAGGWWLSRRRRSDRAAQWDVTGAVDD